MKIKSKLNLDFENAKAAKEPIIIEQNVVTTVINKVLKKYLETGISRLLNNDGNAR